MSSVKRALITGLSGFTGQYVATELISAGYEVYGIGAGEATAPRYTRVDLKDRGALRAVVAKVRPHVVVHLAALAFVAENNAEAFYHVNTLGTRYLLEALLSEMPDVECVLLASSANVYGNSTEAVLSELTAVNPVNDYAVSKLAMEYMARLWFDKLPIVITRPFNYTGVGQSCKFLLPKIVDHFHRGAQSIELGNLDVYRDFSDVRDVAKAYRLLIEKRPSGEIFNVCSGISYSLREALNMVSQEMGRKIEVIINPSFVRAQEVRSLLGSPDRLRSVIGEWAPVSFSDTLKWMCQASLQ